MLDRTSTQLTPDASSPKLDKSADKERTKHAYCLGMSGRLPVVALTLVVGLAGCASNRADVYIANPCDRDLYVRLNYAPIIPGGDVDHLTAKVPEQTIKEFGTLGTENLEGSYLEAFADSSYREAVGTKTYGSAPELQSVARDEVYLMFVPTAVCSR